MQKKSYVILAILSVIVIVGVVEISYGWASLLFDQVPYNYTSTITIPSNNPQGGSLSGYYNITGKGRNFKIFLQLPGAEQGESPLDYTTDGMNGQGHIQTIKPTLPAMTSLLQGNFRKAMLNTYFKGYMDVSCAAWTGRVDFENNITIFPANFTIDGPLTDWEGGFNIVEENNRLVIKADYIYYPSGNKNSETIKHVVKDTYI
jgi:hypothetical protein